MAELVKFAHHGASRITTQIIKGVYKKLPVLKIEFAQINAPKYPHLVDQLEFLADVVEDFAEGQADELPLFSVAMAAFALIYAHRQWDLIPDSTPEIGHADDSGVVRVVLIENEKVFSNYAEKLGRSWSKITVEA
jgi:uncharacterized membrane protein YkvA (DUF1232 family)